MSDFPSSWTPDTPRNDYGNYPLSDSSVPESPAPPSLPPSKSKRNWLIAAAIIAILVLIGISSGGSKTEKTATATPVTTVYTPPTTVHRTTTTLSENEIALLSFHTLMKGKFPDSTQTAEDEMGKAVCDMLDSVDGDIKLVLMMIATTPSMSSNMDGYTFAIGVSVPVFCPRYNANIDAL